MQSIIQAHNLSNVQYSGASVDFIFYISERVVTPSNEIIPEGAYPNGIYYRRITVPIVGGVLRIPAIPLPTTNDTTVVNAKWNLKVVGANGQSLKSPLLDEFILPVELGASPDWSRIIAYNSAVTIPFEDGFLTRNQTIALVNNLLGAAISSVNGQTGAVILTTAHVNEALNRRYVSDAQLAQISGISVEIAAAVASEANTRAAADANLTASVSGKLTAVNNLSDLANAATARTNLGLGTLATQSGTFSGTSSGTNTGDETLSTIKSKLGITTLSGNNTGDQDLSAYATKTGADTLTNKTLTAPVIASIVNGLATLTLPTTTGTVALVSQITGTNSGTNTGDETLASIKTKLGITTLSGSNTGDQDLSGLLVKTSNLSDVTNAATARANLGLAIGSNVQAHSANLTTFAGIAPSANVQTLLNAATFAAFKTSLSLNAVENTALSTWAGSANITTVGTVTTGVWEGSVVAVSKGGTGQTTANAALNALLPAQTGFNGRVLKTDGANTFWAIEAGAGGATWGAITGTLSNQADLSAALSARLVAVNNLSDLANALTARTNLGLGTLATQSGTFSGTSSGTNTGDQTVTLTGDVTGSGTGSFAATIGANKVTLVQMAQVATATILGRSTASTGNVEALTVAQTRTLLGLGTENSPTFAGLSVPNLIRFPANSVLIGTNANASNAAFNSAFGVGAAGSLTTGTGNTDIGYQAGFSNSTGAGNVKIGYQAGYLETGSNKLYIANSSTTSPLIFGDFQANTLRVNGSLACYRPHDENPASRTYYGVADANKFVFNGTGETRTYTLEASSAVGSVITFFSNASVTTISTAIPGRLITKNGILTNAVLAATNSSITVICINPINYSHWVVISEYGTVTYS